LKQGMSRLPRPVRHIYTLLLVMIGWVLFRAETFSQASLFLQVMFIPTVADSPSFAQLVSRENLFFALTGFVFCMPWLEKSKLFMSGEVTREEGLARIGYLPVLRDGTIGLILLFFCTIYIMSGTYNPFIYFRF
jgi:alginate O-acetyltransferase complex protein AlgI